MNRRLTTLLFAAAALAPLSARAQEAPGSQGASAVQEVVVTAQKRSEKLQNVPVSITALSAGALQSADVTDERSLVRVTPALRMDQTGIFTQPTIRGVGSGTTSPGAGANVATYVDGFYQPSMIGNDFDLGNVTQVDVLKGPQGTLFGRNATGGAILITTKDPSFTYSGEASASYRSFNDARGELYLTGPITDDLAFNLSVYGRHSDGWKTDIVTGQHDSPNHTLDIRGKLLWKPTDKLKFTLILQHSDIDDPSAAAYNTFDGNSIANCQYGTVASGTNCSNPAYGGTGAAYVNARFAPNYNNTAMPNAPKNTIQANAIYLKGQYDFDWAQLTSYTGLRQEHDQEVSQLDRTSAAAFTAAWAPIQYTFTQEFNLTGKQGPLDWVLGAFYDHDKNGYSSFTFNGFNVGGEAYVVTDAVAGFADGTYQIVPNLFLTAGLRYSEETQNYRYAYDGVSGDTSHSWNSLNERAILRYELAPNTNVYASFSTGFKSGVFNTLTFPTPTLQPVNPETINAYEIGFKTAQSSWQLNAAAFYYDYNNLQFTAYHFNASTNSTNAVLENAASATIWGGEVQGTYQFSHDLDLRLGMSYTHGRYNSFPGAGSYVPIVATTASGGTLLAGNTEDTSTSASGKTLIRAPAFTLTAGADYNTDLPYGRLTLSGNVYYTTKIFFDPADTVSQSAYATLDLKATWTLPDNLTSLAVFGDNVTDTHYVTQVAEDAYGYGGVYADPAVFGVQVNRKF